MINHKKFITRIYDILKADKKLNGIIEEFRIGDHGSEGDEKYADSYPLLYVTTATQPVVSKKTFTSSSINRLPGKQIELEYWAVVIVEEATPVDAQMLLYDIEKIILDNLENNVRLTKKNGTDPLCMITDVFTQRRHEKSRGSLIEAMTIRIRPTVFQVRS